MESDYSLKETVVLLFVQLPTHFKEIIRVAEVLMNSGRYMPMVLFNEQYDGIEADINILNQFGIRYFETSKADSECKQDSENQPVNLSKERFYHHLLKLIEALVPKFLFSIKAKFKVYELPQNTLLFIYRKLYNKQNNKLNALFRKILIKIYSVYFSVNIFKKSQLTQKSKYYLDYLPQLMKEYQIQLIILPEHNLFYLTHLLVYIGKKLNISSIIVPFTIANTKEWLETFVNQPQRHVDNNFFNEISAGLFPNWVQCYKNQKLILPPVLIFLHEMLHITPKTPWLINSGDIDFLATESQAMKNYYTEAGIAPESLRITGPLYNDILYHRLQNAEIDRKVLFESLGIDSNKPIILCALPPDQLTSRISHMEFASYEAVVRAFIETLSRYSENHHIIINLHPRTSLNTVPYINEYPVYISNKNIADLVPLCNLFVASCSATIRMAISCAIPVINYDLYHYHYDDYCEVGGVITIDEYKSYTDEIDKILNDKVYYNHFKSAQTIESQRWGKPDGLSGKNLIKEIDLLLSS